LQLILEVSLVEDVSFGILDKKDDAAFMDRWGFGVGFEGITKAWGKRLGACVFGKV
jgi:hypothetical protein